MDQKQHVEQEKGRHKNTNCMIPFINSTRTNKTIVVSVTAREGGRRTGKETSTLVGTEVSVPMGADKGMYNCQKSQSLHFIV